jgi:two-component system, NarL family, sensor histidine kinase DevS
VLCLALCAVIVLHALGLIDSAAWGYRYVTFVFAVLIFAIAFASWWHARQAGDGQKLRSKTFGQILLIGYLPAMVSIPLWTFRPDLPQIAFIQNLAIGVVGIPVVIMVSQSAQYQLHAFWWRLWLVLVAVVFALVGASILILFSGLSAAASLGIMLGIAVVSVYALRGWLEKRLVGKPPAIEQFLPQLMALQGLQSKALEEAWQSLLREVFSPQYITPAPFDPPQVSLDAMGDSLHIPALGSVAALSLTGAGSFTRSFGRADERLATSLHALALQGLQARASFVAGAVQERKRIAADLHDDIGGKLLHLANSGGAEGQYARNTLEDLRTITRGLSAQPRPLPELLADLQYQLSQRAERSGIELRFETQLSADPSNIQIGSRQSTVLASICSELLRNAMQHPGVRQVRFALTLQNGQLGLRCDNDGATTEPSQWKSGLGTTSIRRRVHDLQGQCDWQARAGGGASFSASWPLSSWLSADTGSFMADQLL